jgi:cytoskeletal protein RodZ
MEVNPNSTSSNGNAATPNSLGNVQRPGEYLRQVRVSQQRELQAVSDELNIPVKTLTALEQDNYKVLPEATFIKGYYRTYAKFLGVDASNIIQRFDDIYANDTGLLPNHALNNSPIKIMGKLPGSNRDRNRKWLKRSLIAIVVIAVLAAIIAFFQSGSSNSDEAAPEVTEMSDVQILTLDGSTDSNVIALTGDQLQLDFNAPTSVNIVDATGKTLASGRQASSLNLSGEAPFQIRIDDAAAVSLKLNNETVALAKYTTNGKADFSLSR